MPPVSPWTEDRVEMLRSLALQGYTATEIALMIGPPMTKNSIIGAASRRCISLGRPRAPDLPAPPKTKTHQSRWLDHETEALRRLYDAKTPLRDIAAQMGRTESACVHKLQKLGYRDVVRRAGGYVEPEHKMAAFFAAKFKPHQPLPPSTPIPSKSFSSPVRLIEAERWHCTWMVDGPEPSPGGWYCGAPVVGGAGFQNGSWCAHHRSIGVTKVREERPKDRFGINVFRLQRMGAHA